MMIITFGFLSAIGFVTTMAKISPDFLKKVLGYDWVVDIVLGFAIIFGFGMSGTISGMMIGVIADLAVSLVLWVARKTWKYQLYQKDPETGKRSWVEYDGDWTIQSTVKTIKSGKGYFSGLVNKWRDAWNTTPETIEEEVLLCSAH